MKKIFLFLVIKIGFLSCLAQTKKAVIYYKINNTVIPITSIYINDNGNKIYENHSKKEDGIINANIDEPKKVIITLNNDRQTTQFFWLHEGESNMTIDGATKKILFQDSNLNNEYLVYKKTLDSIRVFEKPFQLKLRNENTTIEERDIYLHIIDSIEHIAANAQYDYLLQNSTSFLALDFLRFHIGNNDFEREKLKKLFYILPLEFHKYPTYLLCKEALEINNIFNIGDTLNDVSIKLQDGSIKKLKDLLTNKYTYLDFWSTGCQGSRKNHKAIGKCNKKLNKKITFISVADDNNKETWLESSKVDKIKWNNSCDFKGILSPVKMQFNIRIMPTGILLDKNGVIIKNDFRSIDVELLIGFINSIEKQAEYN